MLEGGSRRGREMVSNLKRQSTLKITHKLAQRKALDGTNIGSRGYLDARVGETLGRKRGVRPEDHFRIEWDKILN